MWLEAGRPGVEKLYVAALRSGLSVKRQAVQAFVKSQETKQIYEPGPKSDGKVTASRVDDRWQGDLIDFKQMDSNLNQGFKNILVVVDIFSRFCWAVPMETKSAEATTKALEGILRESGRKPSELDTDGGLEFTGATFESFLEGKEILHKVRAPGHANALAVVDVVIKSLKEKLVKDMAEDGSQNWAQFLPKAVKAHNTNSHEHLMGAAPADVKGNLVLQYSLEKYAGVDAAKNVERHMARTEELRKNGAFRVLLPGKMFSRTTTAKWSNEVHKVKQIIGTEVEDEKGQRFLVRHVLPVPANSKDAKAAADAGTEAKRWEARDQLTLFAQALIGMLGSEGLSLQGAGLKLRQVPGFSEAMVEARLPGVGALERFVRLFPDVFAVEGEGQKKRVRRNAGVG